MRAFCVLVTAVLVNACAASATYDLEITDRRAIEQVAQDWITAYKAGDLDRLMMLYTDDAMVMLHGQPALRGKPAIREFFAPTMGRNNVDFQLETERFELHGDAAHYVAKYWLTAQPRDGGESYRDAGRSMLVYKRDNGQWKIHADIDQSTPDVQFPAPGNDSR